MDGFVANVADSQWVYCPWRLRQPIGLVVSMSIKRDEQTAKYSRAFGEAVRRTRKRTGKAQDRFAIQAGIDRAFFSGVERGVRNPTLITIWRIAMALETTPSKLIREAEKLFESGALEVEANAAKEKPKRKL